MYVDNNLYMSDAQAVTVTAVSTKSLDFQAVLRDIGAGEPLELIVGVVQTATAAGAATLTVALQDSADNATFADVVVGPVVPKASLVAGFELLRIRLPWGLRRYIAMNYTVATGPLTAGTFNAFVNKDRQANTAQASGFTVL